MFLSWALATLALEWITGLTTSERQAMLSRTRRLL
jgi:hypothetical protein